MYAVYFNIVKIQGKLLIGIPYSWYSLFQYLFLPPLGVQKERMVAEDMYVMSADGKVLSAPVAKPWPNKPPKCSDCAPLFMKISHMEMIKGIKGHGFRDELVIPIIENTPYEYELTDSLSEAISAYPKATAVLVRNHGIYVWGDSWINAKTQCTVLDIEGTTTPISFVTDVMFPYARDNVRKHLTSTLDSEETKEDIKLLRAQIDDDLRNGISGAVPVPPSEASKEEVINALVANVESMIKADRKITSLKQLQGHIWRTGFEKKELQGIVFDDVPEALKNWHDSGIKVFPGQTRVKNKRETRSYSEISQSLGVDSPSQILFITDVFQEAVAAKNAGND
ncbi:hypothetical protein PR202_gb29492 [Eleusine coracana subsp. coracana]|uniref:Class II aldolase/adducin N-terminal domain-containing protein n=1 Tax=Eleusine coracana subsp. coracana TaxID=191504 RepID=A0AAV5FZI1_ELECO|nr:hypothetical protein PR202_gb29492 [Eleusine coracana subsp. coracana]